MPELFYPFMDRFFTDDKSQIMAMSWRRFFEGLFNGNQKNDHFDFDNFVVEGAHSGDVISSWKVSEFRACLVLYMAWHHTAQRVGLILQAWAADGTLPTSHFQLDGVDLGNCSDLRFAFEYRASSGRMQLKMFCDSTYSLRFGRISW